MTTRVFFLNSTVAQYGEEEMNHVQKFLFEQGVLNTEAADWPDWVENGDLKVTERGAGANMSVDVAPGWAIIETVRNAVTFKVFAQNLTAANLPVTANSSGNNRVDAVIMRVSRTAEPNVLMNNVVTLEVVEGNGTDAMTDEEIATAIDSDDDFIRLADIVVPDSTSDIEDEDIVDTRVRAVTTDAVTYSPTILRFRTLYDDPSESDIQSGDVWFSSSEGLLKYYNGADVIALEPASFLPGDGIDITLGTISARLQSGGGLEFEDGEIKLSLPRIADVIGVEDYVATESISQDDAVAATLYQSSGIGIDTTGTATGTSTNITIGNNANRVLILAVTGAGSSGQPTNPNISWNGSGQSIKNHGDFVGAGNNHYELSYAVVIAPSVGTFTFSVTSTYGTNRLYWWSLYNCQQTVNGTHIAFNGVQNGTALSINGAATVNGGLYLGIMGSFSTNAPSSPSGVAYAANTATGSSPGYAKGNSGVSNLYGSGTNITLAHTGSTSASYVSEIIEIIPYTAPSAAVQKASSASANARNTGFIGFAREAKTAGQTIKVSVSGVHEFASKSIAPGIPYYLNDTQGTIGQSAGSQSRKVGMGVGGTRLLITNNW